MVDKHDKYFRVLGIKPGSPFAEVKRSYRNLVKAWHPDRFFDQPSLQRAAHQKLININEAFEVLSELFAGLLPIDRSGTPPVSRSHGDDRPSSRMSSARQDRSHSQASKTESFPADSTAKPAPWPSPPIHAAGKSSDRGFRGDDFHNSSKMDPNAEVIWRYHQAAEQGFEDAQFRLGLIYFNGQGVTRDVVEAYKWLSLAVGAKGRESLKAKHYLDRLHACMTREQIAQAQIRLAPFQTGGYHRKTAR